MLAKRLADAVPVVIARQRVAGAQALIASGCDVVISDDGLQHYDLARNVEIAVVDGARGNGNGWCLPAGPLREPPTRLAEVDFIVVNGAGDSGAWQMSMAPSAWLRLPDWEQVALGDADAAPSGRVHAVAGMGNPGALLRHLAAAGAGTTGTPVSRPPPLPGGRPVF